MHGEGHCDPNGDDWRRYEREREEALRPKGYRPYRCAFCYATEDGQLPKRRLPHELCWHCPALTPVWLWMADMLALWAYCGKAACRRTERCRGEPRACLDRLMPLIPEEVREGVKVMLAGKKNNLDFDAMRAQAPDEVDAVIEWVEDAAARKRVMVR
jgi:hypothetical protein